jgi:NitT/TauT family transport system ATP-binding protein
MIECRDLSVYFGTYHALKRINLNIPSGSTCAIIGRSGSGKTTLLHTMAGLKKPDQGGVYIGGNQITGVRKGTCVVLQGASLFPWKTVRQNLSLALDLFASDPEKRIQKVLEELEILKHIDKFPYELSEGERQRVAIARAIVCEPDVLIMDEPTASLDAITKEVIQEQILKLHKTHGMALVLVTHDIEEAVFLGRQIFIIKEGEITDTIDNTLFGSFELKKQLPFYERCIALREVL